MKSPIYAKLELCVVIQLEKKERANIYCAVADEIQIKKNVTNRATHLPASPAPHQTGVRGKDRCDSRRRSSDRGWCREVWARSSSRTRDSSPHSMSSGWAKQDRPPLTCTWDTVKPCKTKISSIDHLLIQVYRDPPLANQLTIQRLNFVQIHNVEPASETLPESVSCLCRNFSAYEHFSMGAVYVSQSH